MPYPFRYFANLWPLRKAFQERRALSWPQLLFTWLFLLALTCLPTSLSVLSRDTYPLEQLVPQAYRSFTSDTLNRLKASGLDFDQTPVQLPTKGSWQVGADWITSQEERSPKEGTAFVWSFQPDYLVLYQAHIEVAQISYEGLDNQDLGTPKQWRQALDQAWFQTNQQILSLLLLALNWGLLTLNTFLVTLGSSVLLYLASKSRFTSLTGFKEACHLILYTWGIPTFISCLLGLLGMNLASTVLVQNSLFILLLALLFYQTHFRDNKGA